MQLTFIGTFKNKNFTKAKFNEPFIQDLIFADEMSDYHFELLARWFDFRIGVFEDGQWKNFGKGWDISDPQKITILLKKEEGEYKIVLTLN